MGFDLRGHPFQFFLSKAASTTILVFPTLKNCSGTLEQKVTLLKAAVFRLPRFPTWNSPQLVKLETLTNHQEQKCAFILTRPWRTSSVAMTKTLSNWKMISSHEKREPPNFPKIIVTLTKNLLLTCVLSLWKEGISSHTYDVQTLVRTRNYRVNLTSTASCKEPYKSHVSNV